jgi:hypothetical protein
VGRGARWARRIVIVGLRIGPYVGVLRPRLAMYLDRHVCLNSLDRDSQDSCRV